MKYFPILVLFVFASCGIVDSLPPLPTLTREEPRDINTEIHCPNSGNRILILGANSREVHDAIMEALYDQSSSENYKKVKYTVLTLPGNRKTSAYNITAHELLMECKLIEFYRSTR